MSSLILITAATEEPISVRKVRDFPIRLDTCDDDPTILSLIKAARIYGEHYLKRVFVESTWEYRLDCFPWKIELPIPPLQSVTSVKYIDTGGTLTTLSSSLYTVDTYSEPGTIVPAYNQVWPSTRSVENAVTVRFVAGYGAADDVPDTIKTAIRKMVQLHYDGGVCPEAMAGINQLFAVEGWGCYV